MPLVPTLLLGLPAILIAITIHEYAHALTAFKLGDPTAKFAGRLSLNPLKHIDLLGFIMLLVARFGWAKPVPINPFHFRNPRRDEALVSLAGPLSNLLLAILFGLSIRLLLQLSASTATIPFLLLYLCFLYNVVLSVFNLIPVPPLDGSKILFSLLPRRYRFYQLQLESYGPYILFGIIFMDRITRANVFWGLIQYVLSFLGSMIIGTRI